MSIAQSDSRATERFTASWLWAGVMLLVVLLSAAPTGNQVHTRAVGSAFDPAAVAVATNPKKLQVANPESQTVDSKRQDTFEGLSQGIIIAAANTRPVFPLAALDPLAFSTSFRAAVPAHPLAYARAARAPPHG